MESIALHLLDIIQNSIEANAKRITVEIENDILQNRLRVNVTDDGKGMMPDELINVVNPFYSSRTVRKIGIGLSLLKQQVEQTKGYLHIFSKAKLGTKIIFCFNLGHIDCPPLGNFADIFSTLVAVNPRIEFLICFRRGVRAFTFESKMVLDIFKGINLTQYDIRQYTFHFLSENIDWFYHNEQHNKLRGI